MRRLVATLAALLASLLLLTAAPAQAQVQRNFPATALRGAIAFGEAPEISLNGRAARLAPGSRIRDANNMLVVPGAVLGGRFVVHYTVDTLGLVKDVWLLTPQEASVRPWPTTPDEASRWSFDPAAQAWSKP